MNTPANTELDGWMARLADGDRSAFDAVFERLHGPVNRLCLQYLGNEADAADAMQEALQKVLERASDYDPARRALPWALALAGWECRTVARRRQRWREVPEAEAGARLGEDEAEAFAQRKLAEAAMAVMGTLSEQDRQTLTATFWQVAAQAELQQYPSTHRPEVHGLAAVQAVPVAPVAVQVPALQ